MPFSIVCGQCGQSFVGRSSTTRFCSTHCGAAGRSRRPLADRFWRKVRQSDGCWTWLGAVNGAGYGQCYVAPDEVMYAHRVAWELTHGPLPAGGWLRHSCGDPRCVRPDHLIIGTRFDNLIANTIIASRPSA